MLTSIPNGSPSAPGAAIAIGDAVSGEALFSCGVELAGGLPEGPLTPACPIVGIGFSGEGDDVAGTEAGVAVGVLPGVSGAGSVALSVVCVLGLEATVDSEFDRVASEAAVAVVGVTTRIREAAANQASHRFVPCRTLERTE